MFGGVRDLGGSGACLGGQRFRGIRGTFGGSEVWGVPPPCRRSMTPTSPRALPTITELEGDTGCDTPQGPCTPTDPPQPLCPPQNLHSTPRDLESPKNSWDPPNPMVKTPYSPQIL